MFTDADYGYSDFLKSVDTVLMGRKTYDKVLSFGEYPYKDKTSYVFSQNPSVRRGHNGVKFIADIVEFVRDLDKSHGKDIWLVGGSDVISIFLDAGLLNEIILSIHPIVLSKAIPLFKNVQMQVNLKLQNSIPYENGLVQLHYNIK